MSQTIIGSKYASALFQLAVEKNELDRIEKELKVLKQVLQSEKMLFPFLKSPRIEFEEKKKTLKKAFAGFSQYILNTLLLLTERHRTDHILPMIDAFTVLSNEHKGIAVAKVESVRALTEEEKSVISSVFAKKVNKKSLEIENVVNGDLLGGLKIQIGNRIFDGSLRGKLDDLKRELLA